MGKNKERKRESTTPDKNRPFDVSLWSLVNIYFDFYHDIEILSSNMEFVIIFAALNSLLRALRYFYAVSLRLEKMSLD